MHEGRIVFSQLLDFFPRYEFDKCVRRYGGNHRVHGFSCFDQFLAMAFAQLTGRESLRDIETCLRAMGTKLYHAGIRGRVSRSTLAIKLIQHMQIYLRYLPMAGTFDKTILMTLSTSIACAPNTISF